MYYEKLYVQSYITILSAVWKLKGTHVKNEKRCARDTNLATPPSPTESDRRRFSGVEGRRLYSLFFGCLCFLTFETWGTSRHWWECLCAFQPFSQWAAQNAASIRKWCWIVNLQVDLQIIWRWHYSGGDSVGKRKWIWIYDESFSCGKPYSCSSTHWY